ADGDRDARRSAADGAAVRRQAALRGGRRARGARVRASRSRGRRRSLRARQLLTQRQRLLDRLGRPQYLSVWLAFAVLLLFSQVVAPTSVSGPALKDLLFFGGILGIAALGQHLTVVDGVLDLSVGAQLSFGALLFAQFSEGHGSTGRLLVAAVETAA